MSLDDQNRFVLEDFSNRSITDLQENATLYEIRMGLQIELQISISISISIQGWN